MFGISGFELLIILALILVIFGPDKLPELGRTVGRAMGMFKRAQEDMERVIRAEMYSHDKKATDDALAAATPAEKAPQEPAEQMSAAAAIWAATDEDDEEEDEE